MTAANLKQILTAHAEWLAGNGGACAYLRGADLSGADLRSADLSGAYLRGADLSGADLRSADLRSANLSGANLRSANLSGANLRSANLSGANLRSANLSGAYLRSANLRSANLSGAYLRSANLSGAYLRSANLSGAYLDPESMPAFFLCPDFGSFTAWKKLRGGIVAQLLIPAEAKRTSSLIGRKCRAEYVEVVALSDGAAEGFDLHAGKTRYAVGETVRPDSYNDDIRLECTNGIHFLITKREAEQYE